jgi:hypothetical protein
MNINSAIDAIEKDTEEYEVSEGRYSKVIIFTVVLIGEVICNPMN